MIRSLVSYYGGKQRIASRIVEEINQIPHTVYVEPYAGGAAVLFAKPRKHVKASDLYREAINDLSNELITLYRVAVERPLDLALKLEATLYSQTDHARSRMILKNASQYDDLTIAWAYFVQANCSFAHCIGKGWRSAVVSQNEATTWFNRILCLRQTLDRLQGVHVSCEDALKCVDRWDAPQTLFYCDPPYPGTNCGHYQGFKNADWVALCDKLDMIQGSYILSNYEHEYQPKTAQVVKKIGARMSAAGSGRVKQDRSLSAEENYDSTGTERTEWLWIKAGSKTQRKEIEAILKVDQLSLIV